MLSRRSNVIRSGSTVSPQRASRRSRRGWIVSLISICVVASTLSGGAVIAGAADSHQPPNLIVNGDFESGNVGFGSDYAPVGYICTEGVYVIASDPSKVNCYGDWASFGDHTSGSGLMMIVNGAVQPKMDVWRETVPVRPGTIYKFVFWARSVNDNPGCNNNTDLQPYFNGAAKGNPLRLPATEDPNWHEREVGWSSGAANQATISLVDLDCNDFALDDISLTHP